jgi:hypothetical protein
MICALVDAALVQMALDDGRYLSSMIGQLS